MRRASEDLTDPDRNMAESTGDGEEEILDIHDSDTMNPTDEENRIFTPPARIAARFYKPTNSRRKSSAASSRRNSISSAHSHQSFASNRSYHGGPQSNHVAQHLRRASILEDRKARLADRAAHAEKVRLRAALAKAAPRSTNNFEERALAAQQTREKNLAEIVASCAEEVKRAKGIAESMKEKREAENKKLRRDMEERLAEAEKRREEILSRAGTKRGRSMSRAADSMPISRKTLSPMLEVAEAISETTAASRIQQRWRIHQRWKVFNEFSDLGLSIEGVRDTSFEDVVALLAQEKVLLGTAHILRLCGMKEGISGSVDEMTAVRTFLSAFLILGHPTQVLSSKGDDGEQEQVGIALGAPIRRDDLANPQLQDLVAKARDLLISFENVLSRLTAANNYTPPPARLQGLTESYYDFYNAFIAWKARDSSTLIDMMILQFVELDAIWQTVKDSTEAAVTESYREGIRDNQLQLMVRIKRLAGAEQGKRLITNAVREARKARAKKPIGDSRPRETDGNSSPPPALGDLAGSERAITSHLQVLTPPATPRRDDSVSADELRMATSLLPDNRTVVHELAINKEYRIAMEDCLEKRGAFNRVLFDTMRREIEAGRSEPWVLAMAENIKAKLQRLLKEGNSLHTLIGEALDSAVISRELESGSFSYERFFAFMASILPRLCAPFRDDEVKKLIEHDFQAGDAVDRLVALMHFIDTMHLDYANFMLQRSAPELIKHAISYEQKRFSEELDQNVHTLQSTERWWRASRNKVLAEVARRDPEGINLPKNRPSPERFYAQMVVDIFTTFGSNDDIPETLRLDHRRISRIRSEILNIVTTGAILLQSKNLLKRDVRSQWKTEASRIINVLEGAKTADAAREGIQVALESSRSMPTATKAHIRELVRRIVDNNYETANNGQAVTEPVMRLLLTRLRGHILGRLSAITASEKVKATSTASEGLATLGLPEFVASVGKIVDDLGKVGAVDREAHAIWYEIVAKKIEAEDEPPQ
jgi:hypothetical protein